jgi:hypothetical protein
VEDQMPEIAEVANKYQRLITERHTGRSITVDIYDVLTAYAVTCPAIAHAIKKLLMPGQRGGKDARQDLEEALVSVQSAIALHGVMETHLVPEIARVNEEVARKDAFIASLSERCQAQSELLSKRAERPEAT